MQGLRAVTVGRLAVLPLALLVPFVCGFTAPAEVGNGHLPSSSLAPAAAPASAVGYATTVRARGSSRVAVTASRGGRGGRGARGRGGRGKRNNARDEGEGDDVEISTYVSCPKCMADSFILPEVIGEGGRRLRCASCGKSFNATLAKLRDVNDVYSGQGSGDAKQSSFTEDSFFEMFGDKKTLPPPE